MIRTNRVPRVNRLRMMEKLSISDVVVQWLGENPTFSAEVANGSFDFSGHLNDINDYLPKNGIHRVIKLDSFEYNMTLAMQKMGNGLPVVIATGSATNAAPVVPKQAPLSQYDQETMDAYTAARDMSLEDKFDLIKRKVEQIAAGDKYQLGLLLYGRPGIGKTYRVNKTLKENGIKPVEINGKVADYNTFIRLIYANRVNRVLVFDDCDNVLTMPSVVMALKALLQRSKNGITRTFNLDGPIGKVGDSNYVPREFQLSSRIIFLSNMKSIDWAISSRLAGSCIRLNGKRSQIMDLVRGNMKNIVSEASDQDRLDVMDFLNRYSDETKFPDMDFDFRVYETCLVDYLLCKHSGDSLARTRAILVEDMRTAAVGKKVGYDD